MSRSVRKTPICGLGADSEKIDKMLWHRKMRALIRQRLHNFDPDLLLLPLDNEAGNLWAMGKDGKTYFDPREFPKVMRK